jgi:hypothetical protein
MKRCENAPSVVFTTFYFIHNWGLITWSVTIQKAGKVCQGQTLQLIVAFSKAYLHHFILM